MKPEDWQIQEALDRMVRTPEFHYISEASLAEILLKIGLIQLDETIHMLEKEEKSK